MSKRKVIVGTCWPPSSVAFDFEEIKAAIMNTSHIRVCAQSVFFIHLVEEIIACTEWSPVIEVYAPFFGHNNHPGAEETELQKHENEKLEFLKKIALNHECGTSLYDSVEVMSGGMEFRENFFTDCDEVLVYGLAKPDLLLMRKILYAASQGVENIQTIISEGSTDLECQAWDVLISLLRLVDVPRQK